MYSHLSQKSRVGSGGGANHQLLNIVFLGCCLCGVGVEYSIKTKAKKKKKPSWKAPEVYVCVCVCIGSFWVGVYPQRSLDKATESYHFPEGAKIRDDHAVGRGNLW